MARRPKLYTWLQPDSPEYKSVVHAYFHLLQWERWQGLTSMAYLANAPQSMADDFEKTAENHFLAYKVAIADMPMFEGYLMDRQLERLQWRVELQASAIIRKGERNARANSRDRKKENKARRQYRKN